MSIVRSRKVAPPPWILHVVPLLIPTAVFHAAAVEQAREVDKLAKEKGKLIDAAEVKNKMQWQKPARRTGAASGGGRHAGRGRRAAIVLDADAAKSADLEDEREAAAFETKVTNLMMRMDIQRDRATLFLGQHGGHAGKVSATCCSFFVTGERFPVQ
eukprot:SAG31_NODE_1458_length_8257_cov_10.274209_6_plen_157_part_00